MKWAYIKLDNLDHLLSDENIELVSMSSPFKYSSHYTVPPEDHVMVVYRLKNKDSMRYFIIGIILFVITMVVFYFTGLIPEPATLALRIFVVAASVATLGLGFWEMLFRGIFKRK